jgi:hypothetical protein
MSGPTNETDHEFRARMAAEGRAVYVPGKTADQVRDGMARRARPVPLALELSADELERLNAALPDAMLLIEDSAAALTFLADGLVSGMIEHPEPGLLSVLRLSARALRTAGERELMALDMLDQRLRQASAQIGKGEAA